MKLTQKLLGHLNRVFDKEPGAFVGLRIRYAGGMTWSVAEGVLTLSVTGGVGSSVAYNLGSYTLKSLAAAVAGRPGFEVAYLDAERANVSALVLLDGSGDQDASNGDRLLGYTSLLWAIFEALAVALQSFRDNMAALPAQLVTTTAEGSWLDELGSYYGIVRQMGEVDATYGQRIIAETVRPVSNNVAMESAIAAYTAEACRVLDVVIYGDVQTHDGSVDYDGAVNYDAVTPPRYGLFDVEVAYDLIAGGDITTFLDSVRSIVGRLRAAGTHLRALALTSASPLTDAFPFAPADTLAPLAVTGALADTMSGPADGMGSLDAQLSSMVDALDEPTESVDGGVLAVLTDESGSPITDESGNPILVPVEPLFL